MPSLAHVKVPLDLDGAVVKIISLLTALVEVGIVSRVHVLVYCLQYFFNVTHFLAEIVSPSSFTVCNLVVGTCLACSCS